MIIGAHIRGGIRNAVDHAVFIGAEAAQFSVSSQRSWKFRPISDSDAAAFRERNAAEGLAPPFLHAIYLVNLGSDDPDRLERSVTSLVNYMGLAAQIGAAGVIFHPGSHNGGAGFASVLPQVAASISRVLEQSPDGPLLCLETMVRSGRRIGGPFGELGKILSAVDNPRLGICLDTQHSYATGYDLGRDDGVARTMDAFDREIGLQHLAAVHANDSLHRSGTGKHGHANIGKGFIGEQGFASIMAHPAFADVPFFLEVPGYENRGADWQNVAALKAIRDGGCGRMAL